MTLWTRSKQASSNARLEEPAKRLLQAVVADPGLHSRFLNMLSLLEHIGSRKIMLSQMKGDLDKEILQHMAEETRHAFFFKNQAERMHGRALDDYSPDHTLCPAAARAYFGRLDAGITRMLSQAPKRTPYLWVSFIIEIRAGWIYHFYQQALEEAHVGVSLKSVIAEEEKHLAEMQESLNQAGLMNDLLLVRAAGLETQLFTKLLDALLSEIKETGMDVAWKKSHIA